MNKNINKHIIRAVGQQLRSPKCEYVREHYHRLIEMGYSKEETKKLLASALLNEMRKVDNLKMKFNEELYIKNLENLPEMPWQEDMKNTIIKGDRIRKK